MINIRLCSFFFLILSIVEGLISIDKVRIFGNTPNNMVDAMESFFCEKTQCLFAGGVVSDSKETVLASKSELLYFSFVSGE